MALQANPDSFLVELTPLSQALIGATHSGASTMQPDISAQSLYYHNDWKQEARCQRKVYIPIRNKKCFKTFDSKFLSLVTLEYHLL